MNKEGEHNPYYNTFFHKTPDGDMMDCYPKSYKYILKLEEQNKQLSEEIGRLKQQNKFLMKRDNILQNLEQWLEIQSFDTSIGVFTSSAYQKVLNKIKELGGV